ncbi:Uncharacterised protein [Chlamydia trachomatis]|nr:Uncharacterised protein [Chlamydia trachomatis]
MDTPLLAPAIGHVRPAAFWHDFQTQTEPIFQHWRGTIFQS